MTKDKSTAAPAAPDQKPAPTPTQVNREPVNLTVNIDKIDEIIGWACAARDARNYHPDLPFAVVPMGDGKMGVIDLEAQMVRPRRVRKNVVMIDVASFASYFNEYKVGYVPRLFCEKNDKGLKVLAVLDYDIAGQKIDAVKEQAIYPLWCDNRVTLDLAYHPDYKTLKESSDQFMEGPDFALFVEENSHLFLNPTGADMLELGQELKGIRKATWKAGARLNNGERKMEYVEEINATSGRGEIVVPDALTLVTPLFEGYPAQEIKAAFRWRLSEDGKKVSFGYRLLTKIAERQAVEEVRSSLASQTSTTILNVASFNGIKV